MLIGAQVGLRAVEASDLAQLLAWRNAPELRQFFRERQELSMHDQLAWHERLSSQGRKSHDTIMFAIQRLEDDELLGACGLCYIDWVSGTAELSLYIGARLEYVDSLLAPDACRLLADYAFLELDLRRLWTETYSFDTGKRALLEGQGFTQEGTLREHRFHHGAYHDSLFFGLMRSEWRGG
jgi:RimJ/RimL family protein N-acetyltransferase